MTKGYGTHGGILKYIPIGKSFKINTRGVKGTLQGKRVFARITLNKEEYWCWSDFEEPEGYVPVICLDTSHVYYMRDSLAIKFLSPSLNPDSTELRI